MLNKNNQSLSVVNKKSISPLIATILLVVVSVIIISILLNWGSAFTRKSLDDISKDSDLKRDDTLFSSFQIYQPRSDGFIFKNLSNKDISFTHYKIISEDDFEYSDVLLPFDSQINITSGGQVSIPILCSPSSSYHVNLVTSEGTYVTVPINNVNYELNSCSDLKIDDGLEPIVGDDDDDDDNGGDPDENGDEDQINSVCLGTTENGSGESQEDPIVICSVDDLNNVRNGLDKHYVLGLSLDLDVSPYNEGFGWEPIGSSSNRFVGSFDGNGNVISNLYINNPIKNYVGLLSYIENAEIKKLGLENVDINANRYVGSFAGYVYNSSISESYSLGYVTANKNLGGFVGMSDQSEFFDNYAITDVFCDYQGPSNLCSWVAGFISEDYNSSFINCYSAGNVVGYAPSYPGEDAPLGAGPTGGFVSSKVPLLGKGAIPAITENNYYDVNASGQSTSLIAVGKTTQEMKNVMTFDNWDFVNVWYIENLSTYPYLRAFNEELPEVEIPEIGEPGDSGGSPSRPA